MRYNMLLFLWMGAVVEDNDYSFYVKLYMKFKFVYLTVELVSDVQYIIINNNINES